MKRPVFSLCPVVCFALGSLVGCQTAEPVSPGSGEESGTKAVIEVTETKVERKVTAPRKDSVDFVAEIKPILEDRCVMCHNRETLPKRPSFENRELALKGDAAGAIIVPGDAEGSRLVVAISSPDFLERAMPPVSHRVTKSEIALIRRWIDEGADWPAGAAGQLKSDKRPAE